MERNVFSHLWTMWGTLCHKEVRAHYDIVFSLLHLRADRRDPEHPVRAGAGEAVGRAALRPPGGAVAGLPGHRRLHPVHLADVPPGQHGAAAHVPGEGALAAPLPRDDRESAAHVLPCHHLMRSPTWKASASISGWVGGRGAVAAPINMMLGSNCFHNIYMNHADLDNNVKYDNINYFICPGKGCLLSASVMIAILIPHLDFLWLEIIL